MAKVVLTGLDAPSARQINRALDGAHEILTLPEDSPAYACLDSDIVFAGCGTNYMDLLRVVRQVRPTLPFIVVSRIPDTNEWLDALEAGATDYCAGAIDSRQIQWLMEAAFPQQKSTAAAA